MVGCMAASTEDGGAMSTQHTPVGCPRCECCNDSTHPLLFVVYFASIATAAVHCLLRGAVAKLLPEPSSKAHTCKKPGRSCDPPGMNSQSFTST